VIDDGRTSGIDTGRDGGGAGEARFVPCTIGFVAGSDGERCSGEPSAGFVPAASWLTGEIDAAADFVAGDDPTASLGSDLDAPGPVAAGVFFIFTTLVGAAVSGRSLGGIS
jgi:hypothetical protein